MDISPSEILLLIPENKRGFASSLVTNERNKMIVNNKGAYYYLDKKLTSHLLSGLLGRLKKVFWPETSFQDIAKVKKRKGGCGQEKTKTKKRKLCDIDNDLYGDDDDDNKSESIRNHSKKLNVCGSWADCNGKGSGLIKGTQVHETLRDFVLLNQNNFEKTRGELDSYSRSILELIVCNLKLNPLIPEFDIFDEDLGIGTSVDMLCVDRNGIINLLEFKTGYKGYYENNRGVMKRTLSMLKDSAKNQASIQVVTAAIILHNKYKIPYNQMKQIVIRIDEKVIEYFTVTQKLTETMGQYIYKDLLDFNQKKNRNSQKKMRRRTGTTKKNNNNSTKKMTK